jgi:hypothetical protein
MAYPTSHSAGHGNGQTVTQGNTYAASGPRPSPGSVPGSVHLCRSAAGGGDGDHQLEKLEFALAVALTRGDLQRSQQLRDAIAALGGNQEEPGT